MKFTDLIPFLIITAAIMACIAVVYYAVKAANEPTTDYSYDKPTVTTVIPDYVAIKQPINSIPFVVQLINDRLCIAANGDIYAIIYENACEGDVITVEFPSGNLALMTSIISKAHPRLDLDVTRPNVLPVAVQLQVRDTVVTTVHLGDDGKYAIYAGNDQRFIVDHQEDVEDGVEVEVTVENNVAKIIGIINDQVADFFIVLVNDVYGSYLNRVFIPIDDTYFSEIPYPIEGKFIRAYYDTGKLVLIKIYNHTNLQQLDLIQVSNSVNHGNYPVIKRKVTQEIVNGKSHLYVTIGKNNITVLGNPIDKPQFVMLLPCYTKLKLGVLMPLDYVKNV